MAEAYAASQRSDIVISYDSPIGRVLNYHVKAQWRTIGETYDNWVATRQPPLFGTEPDARVWALAGEAAPAPIGCSTSARAPGATPWPWPDAATRWTRSR